MIIYKLRGEVLSPLHIGAGIELEPFDYVIDVERKNFHRIALEEFLANLPLSKQSEFSRLTESGNLNRIRQFIVESIQPDLALYSLFTADVTDNVASIYRQKLGDIHNQLLIQLFIRMDGNYGSYIPGSSIKGALRTAVVSQLAVKSRLPKPKPFTREEREFEQAVLKYRDAKTDPFRAVKLSDAILPESSTLISEIKNVGKNRQGQLGSTGIQLFNEITHSKISAASYGKELTFKTELRLDDGLMSKKAVSKTITLEQIRNACNQFYSEKLEMEAEKFYDGSEIEDASNRLLNEPIGENEFLIRLGRFSGVESVTLDEYRNPQPPGKNKGWGNSRNVADMKYPMGWVKITYSS